MSIVLSEEQELFISKALEGNNILVDACIGSGKTTSIQHLCQRFPLTKNILYLTYNRLLKVDAKAKISGKNIFVTNYHGFAYKALKEAGISCGVTDLIQTFNRVKPDLPRIDVLIIDEYQDIELELSILLEIIKSTNPNMQIVAVGDMEQKIYDKTALNVKDFINSFLGKHICLSFTKCFRLNSAHAAMLGRIWNKKIDGVNESCQIDVMNVSEVTQFISNQSPEDVLCLGARTGDMSKVLNDLELSRPEKFNKKTVYASISDSDEGRAVEPKWNSAIFTTFDSSKGLERKYCIVFDFVESYWVTRVKKPQQSYEILRNVFCVAVSRGKERIILVKEGEPLLSENTLATPVDNKEELKLVDFSEMFDFKYKESIEKCYELLSIKRLPLADNKEIDIKTHDCLIDLSPCIGIYQEASFFNRYDIDKAIETYFMLHNERRYLYDKDIKQSSLEKKVLFLTALDTRQWRYCSQVETPFISEKEKTALHERLSCIFSRDDASQVTCEYQFDYNSKPAFMAKGLADVVKNETVYELKFVTELTHEHFLQCACYAVALNLEKGILWNTRKNEMYEIRIPNKDAFCTEVAKTVLKIATIDDSVAPQSVIPRKSVSQVAPRRQAIIAPAPPAACSKECFAVLDTETNWSEKVMSIGICIVEKNTYKCIEQKYYILSPEAKENGMYSYALKCKESPDPLVNSRNEAINDIKKVFENYAITDVFAYNAAFDCRLLHELNYLSWYDVMKIAAYKQFNRCISDNYECYNTGRLKKNYGVEPIFRMLSGNNDYIERHNAACDALDVAKIMAMLDVPYQTYIQNASLQDAVTKRAAPVKKTNSYATQTINGLPGIQKSDSFTPPKTDKPESVLNETFDYDSITSQEAAALLGVSKSTLYNLINNGYISAEKIGNKYYISRESVENYIEEHRKHQQSLAILGAVVLGGFVLFFLLWILILLLL